jgi:uncharacterized protein YjiK
MTNNPNKISLLILGAITVFAVLYAALTWREAPKATSFVTVENETVPYNFKEVDRTFFLPSELEEISGLSAWNDRQVLTIQDEEGDIFIYDLEQEAIVEQVKFAKDRDYEGVTHRDSVVFVLEKDGDIHYFQYQPGAKEFKSEKFESSFSYRNDTEGICFDERSGNLLIVPKGEQLDPAEQKEHLSGIYELDPKTGKLEKEPTYVIDQFRLGEIIYGKQRRYLIKPSGIAVHPQTGHIYVIASVGKALIVLDRNSNILRVELLDKNLFTQPEGITFSPSMDLLISSEGNGRRPLIARFKPDDSPQKNDAPTTKSSQ